MTSFIAQPSWTQSKMPRTRAQTRATQGLFSINDDALRKALTFLSVAEGRRGLGETSKALRALVGSTALERTRFSESYVLRGNEHGIVHALATAMGTRQWASSPVPAQHRVNERAAVLPATLQVIPHYEFGPDGPIHPWHRAPDFQANQDTFRCTSVDPDMRRDFTEASECLLNVGSFVEYQVPFALLVTHFRIAFGNCGGRIFKDWTFEAFDGEREEWRELYHCDESPWANHEQPETEEGWFGPWPPVVIPVDDSIASSRFRIRLGGESGTRRCFHLRAFELFGKVLPPWRLD